MVAIARSIFFRTKRYQVVIRAANRHQFARSPYLLFFGYAGAVDSQPTRYPSTLRIRPAPGPTETSLADLIRLTADPATFVYLLDPSDEEKFTSVLFILRLPSSKSFSGSRNTPLRNGANATTQIRDTRWRPLMRYISLLVGTFLIASTGNAPVCAEN